MYSPFNRAGLFNVPDFSGKDTTNVFHAFITKQQSSKGDSLKYKIAVNFEPSPTCQILA